MRTAASQELLRVDAENVNVRVWPIATLLLTPKIVAVAVLCEIAVLVVLPPFPRSAGSARLMDPLLRPTFVVPVTPVVPAEPEQPPRSLMRFMSPDRDVVMSSR